MISALALSALGASESPAAQAALPGGRFPKEKPALEAG
jgi:hypothetical protein